MGDHSFNREHSGDVKGTHLVLLLCFTRLHFCLGLPPGSASKGRALQADEDVGDRPPETGQDSPAGGLTDRQGRSLHPSRVQHLHLHLGAGQPQRGQKREQSTNVVLALSGVFIYDIVITVVSCLLQKDSVTFSVWDIGGPASMSTVNQCFFTDKALYVVVWNLALGQEAVSNLQTWLLNIEVNILSTAELPDYLLHLHQRPRNGQITGGR